MNRSQTNLQKHGALHYCFTNILRGYFEIRLICSTKHSLDWFSPENVKKRRLHGLYHEDQGLVPVVIFQPLQRTMGLRRSTSSTSYFWSRWSPWIGAWWDAFHPWRRPVTWWWCSAKKCRELLTSKWCGVLLNPLIYHFSSIFGGSRVLLFLWSC